jgi:hypothetical protein
MNKKPDSVENFDFGFSFLDEGESIYDNQIDHARSNEEEIADLQTRVDLLYNSILPFLDNLCKNPDKPTIHWPNRVEKIEDFKQRLRQIAEGNHI